MDGLGEEMSKRQFGRLCEYGSLPLELRTAVIIMLKLKSQARGEEGCSVHFVFNYMKV